MAEVAIVGAGAAGLACAAALGAGGARVTVLDRLPVAGGLINGSREAAALERSSAKEGAVFELGATALRWERGELLAVGWQGAVRVRADALVVAAGTRPRTRAELGLSGDRPAGVYVATVAVHLLEAGCLLGRHPAVLGDGDWARRATQELRQAGAAEVVELPTGTVQAVVGGGRVERLVTQTGEVRCDALVLADGLVPLRNVDGAVTHGAAVFYCQRCDDPGSVDAALDSGRETAALVMESLR